MDSQHKLHDHALQVLRETEDLAPDDTVLLLLSGGASAMFEDPLIPLDQLQLVTDTLLKAGADIVQLNAVRKRLSSVKGGRFAQHCAPARVLTLALCDVPDGRMDTIGSGPTCADGSTCEEALQVARRFHLDLPREALHLLGTETPRQLGNVENRMVAGASTMVAGAQTACEALGYSVTLLPGPLTGEARETGFVLGRKAKLWTQRDAHARNGVTPGNAAASASPDASHPHAWIGFGETTVSVMGDGLGGRNLEVALSAAEAISGAKGLCVLSAGSDGRDGPTPVAGGYADGATAGLLRAAGKDAKAFLDNSDSYHALKLTDGLVETGNTGTNVGDLMVALYLPTE